MNYLRYAANCAVRSPVKAPEFSHITPILRRSLHWLKIGIHTEYKLLSHMYKVLTNCQPDYVHSLISIQLHVKPTPQSSSVVTNG